MSLRWWENDSLNVQAQNDEIEVLESVFESFQRVNLTSFEVKIPLESLGHDLVLRFVFVETYPSTTPPELVPKAAFLDSSMLIDMLHSHLIETWNEMEGEVIIFPYLDWVENEWIPLVEDYFLQKSMGTSQDELYYEEEVMPVYESIASQRRRIQPIPQIIRGAPLTDRKSKFVAFCARVRSVEQANAVVANLKLNKRIAVATHNMVAYRIAPRNGVGLMEGHDEDGEHGAGTKMIFLLRVMKVLDVVVMVTRWYGGIHLGPDRFKHIKNLARDILEEANVEADTPLPDVQDSSIEPTSKLQNESRDLLKQLRWDSRFQKLDIVCGININAKIQECKLKDVPEKFSWIEYFAISGILVWDIRGLHPNLEDILSSSI